MGAFGIWEIVILLVVLFAVTFGGGLLLVAVRAVTGRRPPAERADEPPA